MKNKVGDGKRENSEKEKKWKKRILESKKKKWMKEKKEANI